MRKVLWLVLPILFTTPLAFAKTGAAPKAAPSASGATLKATPSAAPAAPVTLVAPTAQAPKVEPVGTPAGAASVTVQAEPYVYSPLSTYASRPMQVGQPGTPRPPVHLLRAPRPGALGDAPQVEPYDDDTSLITDAWTAVHGKNWILLVALVLVGLIKLSRKYGASVWPFLATDRGGVVLALLWSFATTIAMSIKTGSAFSLQLLVNAAHIAIIAIGSYAGLKKLFFPSGADIAAEIETKGNVVAAATTTAASTTAQDAAKALAAVGTTAPPTT